MLASPGMDEALTSRLSSALAGFEPDPEERRQLVRLMGLFADRGAPPGAEDRFPLYEELHGELMEALAVADGEEIEERFLDLYAHVHMHEAPYTRGERRRLDSSGGYWCHAGGLSPLLRAAPWIGPATVSADLGAGNGLQGLLLQTLYPHRLTIQVEISAAMADIGRELQAWLAIPAERVHWVVADLMEAPLPDADFVYLYRPVRPRGPGRAFYRRLARHLESSRTSVVFSVADCLDEFLDDGFDAFYDDGHLTCYRRREEATAAGRRPRAT